MQGQLLLIMNPLLLFEFEVITLKKYNANFLHMCSTLTKVIYMYIIYMYVIYIHIYVCYIYVCYIYTYIYIYMWGCRGMDITDSCVGHVHCAWCSDPHYNSHCADEKTEAQRDEITCPQVTHW